MFTNSKLIILTSLSIFSFLAYAGPVVSGGGTQTIEEAEGRSRVQIFKDSYIVSITDSAAELLFKIVKCRFLHSNYVNVAN